MSDDLTPDDPAPEDPASDAPTPDGGGRDPELAALLAVPPLDEVTRRRMVDVALAERPRAARPVGRTTAAIGVAAALLIGVLVGAVVVTRPDDPQPTTAARAPEATAAAPKDAAAEGAPPTVAPAPGSENQLGDLGTVDSPAALRAAITNRLETGASLAASELTTNCVARGPEAAGLVAVSAVGTATYAAAGQVVVLVGTTPAGENVAVAVTPTDCTVVATLALRD
jgi:hypothetical protein